MYREFSFLNTRRYTSKAIRCSLTVAFETRSIFSKDNGLRTIRMVE